MKKLSITKVIILHGIMYILFTWIILILLKATGWQALALILTSSGMHVMFFIRDISEAAIQRHEELMQEKRLADFSVEIPDEL